MSHRCAPSSYFACLCCGDLSSLSWQYSSMSCCLCKNRLKKAQLTFICTQCGKWYRTDTDGIISVSAGGFTTSAASAGSRPNHIRFQEFSGIVDEKIKNAGIKIEEKINSRINDLQAAIKVMEDELEKKINSWK
uniref:Uncharacterized protein n=1 Tax=Glossina pallidipes TaxID=7398 RepID=A0A1A9ZMU6_GLOPL